MIEVTKRSLKKEVKNIVKMTKNSRAYDSYWHQDDETNATLIVNQMKSCVSLRCDHSTLLFMTEHRTYCTDFPSDEAAHDEFLKIIS
jgi:hypothetical protein